MSVCERGDGGRREKSIFVYLNLDESSDAAPISGLPVVARTLRSSGSRRSYQRHERHRQGTATTARVGVDVDSAVAFIMTLPWRGYPYISVAEVRS